MKIKKNDKVMIMKGKDRGKTGKVSAVLNESRVLIDGLNVFKKSIRPRTAEGKGETISISKSVAASNVQIVCSSCGKPTRVGYAIDPKSHAKNRICKKCKTSL
ncbi:MAG: 50S ribosomal protein L24 [Patescibacteria group bacterium]|nr:50S ribosomal protein L24 [Patescibacteria group bacterium]